MVVKAVIFHFISSISSTEIFNNALLSSGENSDSDIRSDMKLASLEYADEVVPLTGDPSKFSLSVTIFRMPTKRLPHCTLFRLADRDWEMGRGGQPMTEKYESQHVDGLV